MNDYKQNFIKEITYQIANNIKFKRTINQYLSKEFNNPSEEFTKFIMKQIEIGKKI